jgi:predicted RNA binding protein YcfA (HicA-like mRNA interferase family)
MRAISEKELIRILIANGYELVRQSKHQIYSNGITELPIPRCGKNLNALTCKSILKRASIVVEGIT